MKPSDDSGDTVPNRVTPSPSLEETRPVVTSTPAGLPDQKSAAADSPTLATMPNGNLPSAPKRPRVHRWPWILAGVLLVILLSVLGGWLGYRNAISLRKAKMEAQNIQIATEHFMLGMQAQNNKQYELARAQYVYVIQLDPSFPGAQDKLREVMVTMAVKETPTPIPTLVTPSPTPTKDTRPEDQIFAQAKQQFAAKDWDNIFATIDSLRQIDPKYHAVEIDDMLYVALRYRGVAKILQKADLEGGLYDLALAEQFGPLDKDAQGYRTWVRSYLNGASFWEVDWKKVVEAYEQIYPSFPNMTDGSGLTAIERYRVAARKYADQLAASGDNCTAAEYYKKSLAAVPDNTVALTATAVAGLCNPATGTPVATASATATPSVAATSAASATAESTSASPAPATSTPEAPTTGQTKTPEAVAVTPEATAAAKP